MGYRGRVAHVPVTYPTVKVWCSPLSVPSSSLSKHLQIQVRVRVRVRDRVRVRVRDRVRVRVRVRVRHLRWHA